MIEFTMIFIGSLLYLANTLIFLPILVIFGARIKIALNLYILSNSKLIIVLKQLEQINLFLEIQFFQLTENLQLNYAKR